MAKHTHKDLIGDGYTTYHENGTTSKTTKDLIGDGYTTHHSDGTTSKSFKRKPLFGQEYVETHHPDGSSSVTTKDKHGTFRTHHSNGSETITTRDMIGSGYTSHTTGSSYTPSSAGVSGEGGDLVLPGLAVLGVLSFIALFQVKGAILLLPLLAATIIVRIILTRRFNSGFFFLWFHPATLLCWRLFCRNWGAFLKEDPHDIGVLFGMLFLVFGILMGIIEGEEKLEDHLLYRIYAFFTFAGSVFLALADSPFNRTIPALFGLALIATPIWLLARYIRNKKQQKK